MRKQAVALMLTVALSACAARPTVPETSIAAPDTLATPLTSDVEFERDWWRQFDDPALDELIAGALSAKRDLQAAAARVTAARELAGAARLAHLPIGGVVAGAARQHLSEREAGGLDLPTRTGALVHTGVDLGWEADVFGRLRGRARAAAADARALEMDARAMQVAVAAQVAGAYFDWRGAEREDALLRRLRERTRDLLARTATLVAAGRVTRLDLLRTEQVDAALAADLAAATHAAERARLRLATLLGRTGEAWAIPDAPARPLRAATLPVGAAADVIRRRPDVAGAELRVQVAAARAGAARADLFPRVEVAGTIGLVTGSVGRLAEASAVSWLIAPRLTWAFLDWPAQRRRMRAAGALTDAAFAEYEQTVLVALEEVRVALDQYRAATEALGAAERWSATATEAATIVSRQYEAGLVDSLANTEAARDAIAAALTASRALTRHRQAIVEVYRALGGGWQ